MPKLLLDALLQHDRSIKDTFWLQQKLNLSRIQPCHFGELAKTFARSSAVILNIASRIESHLHEPNRNFSEWINTFCQNISSTLSKTTNAPERLKQAELATWGKNIYQFIDELLKTIDHEDIQQQIQWIMDSKDAENATMPAKWMGNVSIHFLCLCLTENADSLRPNQADMNSPICDNRAQVHRAAAHVFFEAPKTPIFILREAFTDSMLGQGARLISRTKPEIIEKPSPLAKACHLHQSSRS